MNTIRVRTQNVEKFTQALVDAGFDAFWRQGASASFMGGCSDVSHCTPHPEARITKNGFAVMNSNDWATIITNASGNKAHKIFETVR